MIHFCWLPMAGLGPPEQPEVTARVVILCTVMARVMMLAMEAVMAMVMVMVRVMGMVLAMVVVMVMVMVLLAMAMRMPWCVDCLTAVDQMCCSLRVAQKQKGRATTAVAWRHPVTSGCHPPPCTVTQGRHARLAAQVCRHYCSLAESYPP